MEITNPPQQVPYLTNTSGQKIELVVIDIGVWQMSTTGTKNVAHGLGSEIAKAISIEVTILDDAQAVPLPLNKLYDDVDTDLVAGGILDVDDTNIYLIRNLSPLWLTSAYSSNVVNRGTITIFKKV